ncbi:MAG: 4Fe-4S binding protein [Chloroflexi bacterium]|nr:4Fe-4S binding protein [Chloroflexota bacterium]
MEGNERLAYERLAARLDAIPNGFPRTANGVELKILRKLFSPEEATLAASMRLNPEVAAEIGARAGMEAATALATLRSMASRGLILARQKGGELRFGLMPWVVGIYEAQLPRMDRELAELVEVYFHEGALTPGGSAQPPVHRVIPVQEAVPLGIEVAPYEQASAILAQAKSFGVRECICRVQRQLVGKGCHHEIENCLCFHHTEGAFVHAEDEGIRPINREEALTLLRAASEAGLVHTVNNVQDRHSYICNCCTCSCGLLRGVREYGILQGVARSAFRCRVDQALCTGCGLCVERCPFAALSLVGGLCVVDALHCMGCGQCTLVCPAAALSLEVLVDAAPPPRDRTEWMVRRAQERGISLRDVM